MRRTTCRWDSQHGHIDTGPVLFSRTLSDVSPERGNHLSRFVSKLLALLSGFGDEASDHRQYELDQLWGVPALQSFSALRGMLCFLLNELQR